MRSFSLFEGFKICFYQLFRNWWTIFYQFIQNVKFSTVALTMFISLIINRTASLILSHLDIFFLYLPFNWKTILDAHGLFILTTITEVLCYPTIISWMENSCRHQRLLCWYEELFDKTGNGPGVQRANKVSNQQKKNVSKIYL